MSLTIVPAVGVCSPSSSCGSGSSCDSGSTGSKKVVSAAPSSVVCPGCDSGADADTAHLDLNTGDYYPGCYMVSKVCLWCGSYSGKNDYCDTKCAIAEKRHCDADDY